MSLFDFTMPDGPAGADPSTLSDYTSGGDASPTFTSPDAITYGSPGAGYGYATGTDSIGPSASSQTLGQLQGGGSTVDWNQILQGGLSALVAADSIQHGLSASGQALPVYKAPNGAVYPVGQGPGAYPSSGGSFMMLLLIGVVLFAVAEEK
ncbi:hypothetical protein [Burkholderia arboris]|uniref:hypothetical protein n=1 Tax=Burkholderia arboris TaxID=488730 RepID=UPI00210BD924|nr:hypothetical protein [Burkholderia arboris]UTV53234.1 hypothetical protein NLX30_10050 [Burkholderia arboris]